MRPFELFGLARPAFESSPDPRFFVRIPAHVEALATAQYAVYAGKSVAVIVGESGSGKSLLGRIMRDACCAGPGRSAGRQESDRFVSGPVFGGSPEGQTSGPPEVGGRTDGRLVTHDVLWIDAIGQPDDTTEATLNSTGLVGPSGVSYGSVETTLPGWLRRERRPGVPTLLIIDDAEALGRRGWTDVVSLLTREGRAERATTVLLLGQPRLLDVLAAPELARVRRRVFHTCMLAPLDRPQVEQYIRERLATAADGGSEPPQPFTPDAVDSIHRMTRGVPSVINQVCDSAMVSAFAEERREIDARDIVTALRSTILVRQAVRAAEAAQPPAGPWDAPAHADIDEADCADGASTTARGALSRGDVDASPSAARAANDTDRLEPTGDSAQFAAPASEFPALPPIPEAVAISVSQTSVPGQTPPIAQSASAEIDDAATPPQPVRVELESRVSGRDDAPRALRDRGIVGLLESRVRRALAAVQQAGRLSTEDSLLQAQRTPREVHPMNPAFEEPPPVTPESPIEIHLPAHDDEWTTAAAGCSQPDQLAGVMPGAAAVHE